MTKVICDQCETVAHCLKNGCVPKQHDWRYEYQKAVELHCITLDELREADAWIKNLEKLMADQDVMLKRQTDRIVDLQTHINNLEGEDDTSPPTLSLAQRKPLTLEQRTSLISKECRYTSDAASTDHHRLIEGVEAAHNIYAPAELKENT